MYALGTKATHIDKELFDIFSTSPAFDFSPDKAGL